MNFLLLNVNYQNIWINKFFLPNSTFSCIKLDSIEYLDGFAQEVKGRDKKESLAYILFRQANR